MILRVAALLLLASAPASACTDILVTPGASQDGSAYIAYNADSPTLLGTLYHYPPTIEPAQRPVYEWDTGKYLGTIAGYTETTYNVVGNGNEHGLVIGETTFGGVPALAWTQTDGKLDYGSHIYVTLQRAKTCEEAIDTMTALVDQYGYVSGGESFSLADASGDVWMLEMIGTGPSYTRQGAVWVALKIPDGSIAAHANQARITTFPRNDPEHCRYAHDVVDLAVHYGLYPADADPLEFSFSDVYHPVSFISARQGEARVWSIFAALADPDGIFAEQHLPYALGENRTQRMPLYITPYRKVSTMDVNHLMASHYEDTTMDSSRDVGSGLFATPYRPRPLVWTYDNQTYHNERSIATPKTGWSFVAQIRPWMPAPLASILWFACDDSSTAPRLPMYTSATEVPAAYAGKGAQDGVTTPLLQFDLTKAFWVQNMVSQLAYARWKDAYPMVWKTIIDLQRDFETKLGIVDKKLLELWKEGNEDKAIKYATFIGVGFGKYLHEKWMQFYGELFVRFRDFYTIVPKKDEPSCGCEAIEVGLSEDAKRRIVDETGDHYLVLDGGDQPDLSTHSNIM